MLRCGRIAYTNVLPLYAAIDAGVVEYPGSLHAAPPTSLNAMLVDGELDMGPMSAFEWAKHAGDFVLLPGACIGARAAVVSVVLVSAIPPSLLDGKTVYVTDESATGRQPLAHAPRTPVRRRPHLCRRVASAGSCPRRRAGAADRRQSDRRRRCVAAGARLRSRQTLERMDRRGNGVRRLGRSPRRLRTRSVRRAGCMRALRNPTHGRRPIPSASSRWRSARFARKPGFYESYYGKLNFTFDAPAQRGLAAFCRELRAIGAIDAIPSCQPEQLDAVAR